MLRNMGMPRFRLSGISLTCFLWISGLLIFFRSAFISLFDRVLGDPGDGQLIVSLHEHWYRVLNGLESWNQTIFFYPVENALGYSDTFLATGIAFAGLRALGIDPFLSMMGVLMLLASIGFWAMYTWLILPRKIAKPVAAFIAFLFIIASPAYLTVRNAHLQLLYVWLLPMGILLLESYFAALRLKRGIWVYFCGFCFWFGLLVYSAFYVGFFFALLLLIAFTALLVIAFRDVVTLLREGLLRWREHIPGLFTISGWAGLFLYTYLPARRESGGRLFHEILPRIPHPEDLLNHSTTNALWGFLNERFWPYENGNIWPLELGLTPLLALLGVLSVLFIIANASRRSQLGLWIALIVLLGGWAALFRSGDQSVWYYIYSYIPGAEAIRVPSRLSMALLVPALLLVAVVLQCFFRSGSRWIRRIGWLVAALLMLEQIQLVDNAHLDRGDKLALAARAAEPPSDIDACLIFGEKWEGWNSDVPHNTATFLAEQWNLPTINGRTGFAPSYWQFGDMRPGGAFHHLTPWARKKNVSGRIGLYDMTQNRWFRSIDFGISIKDSLVGVDLLSLPADIFAKIGTKDWSTQEPWGVWSNGPSPTLLFTENQFPTSCDSLTIVARGYVHSEKPTQTVDLIINDQFVATWTFSLEKPNLKTTVLLPDKIGPVREVRLKVSNPRTPASLGDGNDGRALGIGLFSLTFNAVSPVAEEQPTSAVVVLPTEGD